MDPEFPIVSSSSSTLEEPVLTRVWCQVKWGHFLDGASIIALLRLIEADSVIIEAFYIRQPYWGTIFEVDSSYWLPIISVELRNPPESRNVAWGTEGQNWQLWTRPCIIRARQSKPQVISLISMITSDDPSHRVLCDVWSQCGGDHSNWAARLVFFSPLSII